MSEVMDHERRDALRRAAWGELERIREARARDDASEARQLELLWRLETEADLERRRAELGATGRLTAEDHHRAESAAREDVGFEWAILNRNAAASGPSRVEAARELVNDFPRVQAALAEARLTGPLARVVCEVGTRIRDAAVRADYESEVLGIALLDTMTPPRLRPRARRIAERLLGSTSVERHARAAKERRVFVVEGDDGMSDLVAVLPSVQAAGIYDRLTQVAKRLAGPDEPRRFDELRADVFAALLLTSPVPEVSVDDGDRDAGAFASAEPMASALGDDSALPPGQVAATVMVTVPALSLLGVDDEPALLDGTHPISLADAAVLAAKAPSWIRVLTDPATGAPLSVSTYRPSAQQRAFLLVRDQHCRFPGCRAPARRCDIDHTTDWAHGGKTDTCNLSCLCRRHHTRKHSRGWSVRQRRPGVLEWTTPNGRTVTDQATPVGPMFTRKRVAHVHQRSRNGNANGFEHGHAHAQLVG